jgi:nucleoside 2-deoxyribosyltransferase
MKVFLSYAVGYSDATIAARLRAVAAAYDISILLPDRTQPFINGLPADTIQKLNQCNAVIALVTQTAPPEAKAVVNFELQAAARYFKPVIALVEYGIQIQGVSENQIVHFNRLNPTAHEQQLMSALEQVRQQQQQWKNDLTALGWIAGIALGLVALSELLSDKK